MNRLASLTLFFSFLFDLVTSLSFDGNALKKSLSPKAVISGPNSLPRWSDFQAPTPLAIVNVASEHDVLLTVGVIVI